MQIEAEEFTGHSNQIRQQAVTRGKAVALFPNNLLCLGIIHFRGRLNICCEGRRAGEVAAPQSRSPGEQGKEGGLPPPTQRLCLSSALPQDLPPCPSESRRRRPAQQRCPRESPGLEAQLTHFPAEGSVP